MLNTWKLHYIFSPQVSQREPLQEKPKINSGQTSGYSYLYDQLNRLLGMKQHNAGGATWSYSSYNAAYEEKLSYDANGNIKTLVRKGANVTGMPLAMDNLKYFYYYTNTDGARAEYDPTAALPADVKSLSNQLAHVSDSDPDTNYTEDIDNQAAGNYDYDNIGNLIKDTKEGITGIEWTVYGKIKQINKGAVTIKYAYDAGGNRVRKEVTGAPGANIKQFYIRDAQGNTLAIYNVRHDDAEWAEQHLYGSSRLGIWSYGKATPATPGAVVYDSMMVGSVSYELTNHLGNVMATISDKKVGVSAGKVTVDYYSAEVVSQNDYYSGGMLVPGRQVNPTSYTYGYQGQLKADEAYGSGNLYSFEFREQDPRLIRFWSPDPLESSYPGWSPYAFSQNRMIDAIEFEGLEAHILNRDDKGNFNFTYDWNAKPLEQGQVYFNGSPANVSDLSKQYNIPLFNPTAFPQDRLGDVGYYQFRYDDYSVRTGLAGIDKPAPDYYLGYGDKYIKRFTFETSKELSAKGNQWLTAARKNLQSAIEDRLNPKNFKDVATFEQNNSAFQTFAFNSHVPAYVRAGVLGLDFLDKTHILVTPDAKDLFSNLGMAQAQAMMKLQLQYYVDNPGTAVYHAVKLPFQKRAIERTLVKKGAKELLGPLFK